MKTLGYFPALYHHDKGMWPPVISSAIYFVWQSILWESFQTLTGWKVLWNAGQSNSNLYDPIQNWKAKNIRYTRKKIRNALLNCDRVLIDFPSTVMWDAQKAKKSYLCLIPNYLKNWDKWIREDVKEKFGGNIKYVCSRDEIVNTLKEWLEEIVE